MTEELTDEKPKNLTASGAEMREFVASLIEQPPGTTMDAPWPLDDIGLQRLRDFCSNYGKALGFLVNVTTGGGIKVTYRGSRENPVPMPPGLWRTNKTSSGIVAKLTALKVGGSVLIDPLADRGRPMKRGQTTVNEASFRNQVWGIQNRLGRTFSVAKIEEGAYVVRRLPDEAKLTRTKHGSAMSEVRQRAYVAQAIGRLRLLATDVASGLTEEGRTTLRVQMTEAELKAVERGAWAKLRKQDITKADVLITVEAGEGGTVALVVKRAPEPQPYY